MAGDAKAVEAVQIWKFTTRNFVAIAAMTPKRT
jgi:hypothetical protein